VIKIKLPALSPTMETGAIAAWIAKEGTEVNPGDIIASIETDKAAVDFESTDNFIIVKHLYPEGTGGLNVNDMIALAAEDEDEVAEVKAMDVAQFMSTDKTESKEVKPEVEVKQNIVKTSTEADDLKPPTNLPETKILISPSAKAIFETNNLTFKTAFSHKFVTKVDALNMMYHLNASKQVSPVGISANSTTSESTQSLG